MNCKGQGFFLLNDANGNPNPKSQEVHYRKS